MRNKMFTLMFVLAFAVPMFAQAPGTTHLCIAGRAKYDIPQPQQVLR